MPPRAWPGPAWIRRTPAASRSGTWISSCPAPSPAGPPACTWRKAAGPWYRPTHWLFLFQNLNLQTTYPACAPLGLADEAAGFPAWLAAVAPAPWFGASRIASLLPAIREDPCPDW